jgi:RNA polymerase sigma-70 factor, ECF subfamily
MRQRTSFAVSDVSDEELLRRIGDGDREAFLALYRRYQDVVYGFAFQMCGSQPAAEDITQETFLGLARKAPRYRASEAKFSTYLYGMVRHLTRRWRRRDRVFEAFDGESADRWRAREPLVEQALVDAASRQETIQRVQRAVLSLPPRYREVIILCDLHSRSYVEAASIMRCAVGTVCSRLHRARVLLRQKLGKGTYDHG